MIQWTDSHAHLYRCDNAALKATVDRARANGVHRILNAATSLSSSRTVVGQCAAYPCLLGAAGISPFDVNDTPPGWEDQLLALFADPRVIAVGETGIDATNPAYPSFELQSSFFEKHLALANRLGRPVIVHSRGCEKCALAMCVSAGVKQAVFHCYTGDAGTLKGIVDAGYFVSFSGIVTFAKSSLASVAACAPLDSILIETDTPYLAPVPHRGKPNQPAWVALVGKKIAEIRKMDEEEFAAAVERNFERAFGAQ
ncbi:MAG TPA: TatD family hydrolase [Chitinivibrionales bacterium]|nr:TatD family hydrolase [Chitinivibrionales bacterium]